MSDISLILLGAGQSTRFGLPVKKQWLRVNNTPLWLKVLESFRESFDFANIVITADRDEVALFQHFTDVEVVAGGKSRQESIKFALEKIETPWVLISDIARCDIPKEMVDRILENRDKGDIVVPYLSVADTVVVGGENVDRDSVKLIQTPQLSKTEILRKLLRKSEKSWSDESSLFAEYGYRRYFVRGDRRANKLTYLEDIDNSSCFKKGFTESIRVGNGFDVHQFQIDDSRKLLLGGVEIDTPLSLKAHSDGDVLIHSLIDGILGGAGIGDIGELFPDSDEKYRNIDSAKLLENVLHTITKIGLEIRYIDITIIAQIPKLQGYKREIRENLSKILQIPKSNINIKATTTEKLGFIGRKEGIGVISTVTIANIDWRAYL